jgi:hypothetical protein
MNTTFTYDGKFRAAAPLRWLKVFTISIVIILSIIFFMALQPSYPLPENLDSSWQYALNEAVARHMIFGRDIVFTCGPLASVYTKMYHPGTDGIMLLGGALIGAALSFGCLLLAAPKNRFFIVALPILISEVVIMRDCFFILLPFVVFLLILRVYGTNAGDQIRPKKLAFAGIAIGVCASALLPLIKGSFTLSVLFSGLASLLILLRFRPLIAVALTSLAAIFAWAAWVAVGQPVDAILNYFTAQAPIVSGYSEAMSVEGRTSDLVLYLAVSLILVAVFYRDFARRFGRVGYLATVLFATTLFVSFKASLVRHDSHALIAGSTLLFAGYLVAIIASSRISIIVWIVAIIGWAYIDHAYTGLGVSFWDPVRSAPAYASKLGQRLVDSFVESYDGVKERLFSPGQLVTAFDERNAFIRAQDPLPPIEGTVDLYPFDLATIFAHGLNWAPRPMIQSFSAYNFQLDGLNASHLKSVKAPKNIFFEVVSIDGRLPALEDSGSWLPLLESYQIVGCENARIQLALAAPDHGTADLRPIADGFPARIGSPVQVPGGEGPVWAKIGLLPTLFGRLCLIAFKTPQIQLTLTLQDGSVVHHRYIPAMGRQGFLLSPYIASANDFGLLAAGADGRKVVSMQIDTPDVTMWHRDYSVQFDRLEFGRQDRAREFFSLTAIERRSVSVRAMQPSN